MSGKLRVLKEEEQGEKEVKGHTVLRVLISDTIGIEGTRQHIYV